MRVRPPAVAGSFYPSEPDRLRALVLELIAGASATNVQSRPKALIVPHAGYRYSGPVAASAYARLIGQGDWIARVLLFGTAHTRGANGLVACDCDAFATPLGIVPVDLAARDAVLSNPEVIVDDQMHRGDHSIEAQLPFLQVCLNSFEIVPLLVGQLHVYSVVQTMRQLWDEQDSLVVVSSDLSHYRAHAAASQIDRLTATAIEMLRPDDLHGHQACGLIAVQALLQLARERGLRACTLDLRNSGDTAGGRDRVVGYGAFSFDH